MSRCGRPHLSSDLRIDDFGERNFQCEANQRGSKRWDLGLRKTTRVFCIRSWQMIALEVLTLPEIKSVSLYLFGIPENRRLKL